MRRGYSKFLTVILLIIIVAVIGLLAYLGYDYYTKYRINKDAQDFVDASTEGITVDAPTNGDNTNNNVIGNINTNTTGNEQQNTGGDGSTSQAGKKGTYQGFYTVGSIEIPKTNVKYPIIEKVTKRSLEKAVAVEWPQPDPVLNEVGNVVIAGHNYRNGVFFSNNKKLSKGDKIYITDLNKNRVAYTIYNIFETTDSDASFYNRDTNGKREITLKTCTDDSQRRLIIEARE